MAQGTADNIWIRLPNWLGDVVMALPFIRELQRSRPAAEITLLGQKHFQPLLAQLGVADSYQALPAKGGGYYLEFLKHRKQRPDLQILFTNSLRGDLEALLTGARQRHGMLRPGKHRPLLNNPWRLPESLDESSHHQCEVWGRWLREADLVSSADFSPFQVSGEQNSSGEPSIGFICGTENDPTKRWPVKHWQSLISKVTEAHPGTRCRLFGTARDRAITDEVTAGTPPGSTENLAGETDLCGFAEALGRCRLLVCNDTGGMHLANALGVPVIGIFGPTNPVRTGPCFEGERILLQPEGCPPTGGMPIAGVSPEQVFSELAKFL